MNVYCFTISSLSDLPGKVTMVGILTRFSLGILVAFHLTTGIGQLFKVSPPYDPTINLVGGGTPGKGETPIEILLASVFGCWYLSSIAGVLLTLKLGSVESQKASLICPLLWHATIALFFGLSPTQLLNQDIITNRKVAAIHGFFALCAIHAIYTIQGGKEEEKVE